MDGGKPVTPDEFIARIQAMHGSLPRRLRQCAEYAARHQTRLAQATVAEFARGAGVQASAVVRFSQAMGFTGYSQMRDLFRTPFELPRPDYARRIEQMERQGEARPAGVLAEMAKLGRLSLERMIETVDPSDFDSAAGLVARAGLVHVVGHQGCFAAAAHLAHILERVGVPVLLHGGCGPARSAASVRADDVVLVMAFSPLLAETQQFCDESGAKGAQVIAISDRSGAARLGKAAPALILSEAEAGGFHPMTATATLAMALAVAAGGLRSDRRRAASRH